MELNIVVKYIGKLCIQVNRGYKGHSDEKLFVSPKKQSKDYFSKALVELKSYVHFLLSDQNINTGREILDIRRAVDNYMNPIQPR